MINELIRFNVKTDAWFLKNRLSTLPNKARDNCIIRLPAKTPRPFDMTAGTELISDCPAKPTNKRMVNGFMIVNP